MDRPQVSVTWSPLLNEWFRAVLCQRAFPAPQVSADVWTQWLTVMQQHGILPLLYTWLAAASTETRPPEQIYQKLKSAYWSGVADSVQRWHEVKRILLAFKEIDVTPVVLKGVALAETYYQRPELRPSTDIDLFVSLRDYEKVKALLLKMGYVPEVEVSAEERNWQYEEAFITAQTKFPTFFPLELHWSFSPFFANQSEFLDTLGSRVHQVKGPDVNMLVLNPADAFSYTVYHLIYGHPENIRLIWLYDIHLLAQCLRNETEWLALIQTSRQWLARLALIDALRLAHEWFGTPIPLFIGNVEEEHLQTAEMRIRNFAMHRMKQGPRKARVQQEILVLAQLGNMDRLRYLRRRLFPHATAIDLGYTQFAHWPLLLAYTGRLFLYLVRLLSIIYASIQRIYHRDKLHS